MTKKLCNKRDIIPPLEKPNGTLALSDLEKANLFSDHLEKIFTPHQEINQNPNHDEHVKNFLSSTLPMSLPAKPVTPSEIVNIIKKLHPKKSPRS